MEDEGILYGGLPSKRQLLFLIFHFHISFFSPFVSFPFVFELLESEGELHTI